MRIAIGLKLLTLGIVGIALGFMPGLGFFHGELWPPIVMVGIGSLVVVIAMMTIVPHHLRTDASYWKRNAQEIRWWTFWVLCYSAAALLCLSLWQTRHDMLEPLGFIGVILAGVAAAVALGRLIVLIITTEPWGTGWRHHDTSPATN